MPWLSVCVADSSVHARSEIPTRHSRNQTPVGRKNLRRIVEVFTGKRLTVRCPSLHNPRDFSRFALPLPGIERCLQLLHSVVGAHHLFRSGLRSSRVLCERFASVQPKMAPDTLAHTPSCRSFARCVPHADMDTPVPPLPADVPLRQPVALFYEGFIGDFVCFIFATLVSYP